jgi:Kinesin motor domain
VFLKPVPGQDNNGVQTGDGVLQRCLQQVLQVRASRADSARPRVPLMQMSLSSRHRKPPCAPLSTAPASTAAQGTSGQGWSVCISAVEIYMEKVKDLLSPNGSAECELITEGRQVVEQTHDDRMSIHAKAGTVRDERTTIRHKDKEPLCEAEVHTVAEAMHLVQAALQTRTVRSTRCVGMACTGVVLSEGHANPSACRMSIEPFCMYFNMLQAVAGATLSHQEATCLSASLSAGQRLSRRCTDGAQRPASCRAQGHAGLVISAAQKIMTWCDPYQGCKPCACTVVCRMAV